MITIRQTVFNIALWWNGRHPRLRIWCPKGRESSSLSEATIADLAEWVDAVVLGTAVRKNIQVRVL